MVWVSFYWIRVNFVLLVIPLFTFASFLTSLSINDRWGAVTEKTAKVYSGPNEKNTVLFEIHEGAPFILNLPSGGWYKIELSDGKKGWMSAVDVKVFGQQFKL